MPLASSTTLTLKPNLTGGVTQALHDRNPFYIAQGGLQLPVVAYDEEYAESIYMEGGRRTRSREQNPEGKVTLRVKAGLTVSQLRTALDNLEQTIQACRVYGGELALSPEGTTAVTYDLETVSLASLDLEEVRFGRAVVEINVTTRPYGRLAPVSLVTNATSSLPIQSVSLASIPGSAPALVQVTITDTATQARDHLEVGLDADWDGSSSLLIDSASMSVSGLAGTATTRTGAYSSSGVIRTTLGTSALGCCEKTALTHRGRHRAKLRVYLSGTGPAYVRVAYRVGSGAWSRNGWKKVPGASGFYEVDCGIVQANASAGTLSVRVEAYSSTSGDTFDVDYLELVPAYRWTKARGAVDTTATGFTLLDRFNQLATPTAYLDAPKVADTGQSWGEANRTAANGFSIDATGHTAQRAVLSDASLAGGGCYAYLGSSVAACSVAATVKFSVAPTLGTAYFGLLARYVDANNWAALVLAPSSSFSYLVLLKKVGGTLTDLQADPTRGIQSAFFGVVGYAHQLRLEIDADGTYRAYWAGLLMLTGGDADLATGGTLASGKRGLFDAYTSGTGCTRNYDNFEGTEPTAQHVVAASGAVILGHESIARSDGTRPPIVEGSYMTCPPAGRESRTHRLAVKMRRNDVDTAVDDQIADGQRVDVTVIPRVVLL